MVRRGVRHLVIGLLVLLGGFVGPAAAQYAPGGHGPAAASAPGFEAAMHGAMVTMAKDMEAAPMTGDPDKDFLAMMIPHHEGALEMARLVLLHGRNPLVRQLAEDIIAAQQAEIVSTQGRLRILQTGNDPNPGGFPALGGTRGPDGGGPGSRP